MKKKLGFIGGGRITRIILQAINNKNGEITNIIVFDINSEVTKTLKQQFPDIVISDLPSTAKQDIVFIALHPPAIMETLEIIRSTITVNTIIISLAPKISLEKISSKLNGHARIVRLIPNATSIINQGYNPVCFSPGIETPEKEKILEILTILGQTFEVAEEKLEAYAIVSAMAPTYFWFQWEELCRIGKQTGLEEGEARQAVSQTIIAALNTFFNSGLSVDEVIDLIPVKPIGDHEQEIITIYQNKLLQLYRKIVP